jgi:glucose/arabinose dehydrogenase
LLVLIATSAFAQPGAVPQGYLFRNAGAGLPSSAVSGIQQLAFRPGDTTHVYASRGFAGTVTRYDYDPATGTLANPFTVANLSGVSDGLNVITGVGFHGNDMWVTRWPGYVNPRPVAITRLRDGNGDGLYETRADFATGMDVGDHNIGQVRIVGNALFTGIGKNTNTGDPAVELSYNGTIARIADLNNPVAVNLSSGAAQATFADSGVSDGRLRRWASGFRNPFGMRVDGSGRLWVTDNGASPEGSFPGSPDWIYDNVPKDAVGRFPPPGQPGAPSPTIDPVANLGLHSAPTGFDFVSSGPDRGDVIIGTAASGPEGKQLIRVDAQSGNPSTFMSGFNITTDVINDPFGRMLIADYTANAVYLLAPPPNGDANLDRVVDIVDLGVVATNWQRAGAHPQGDFDGSGYIDINDLGMLASNWQVDARGPTFAEAAQSLGLPSVPEPGAAWIVVACLLSSLKRPRRVIT